MAPNVSLVPSSLRSLGRLTGPASQNTTNKVGLYGTDLGSSFEHDGALYFLFGDTWPWPDNRATNHKDSVAWTRATNPEDGLQLNFILETPSKYKSPTLREDGHEMRVGIYEVPIAGVSSNGRIYVFYSTDSVEEPCLDGGIEAFWCGPDGAVGTNWANPGVMGARWRFPFPTMAPGRVRPASPLVAITRLKDAADVFMISGDGAVATAWANPAVDKNNWHPPFPITSPGATRADSPLAAVARKTGWLDVFWIGPDGAVCTTWANPDVEGGRWRPPLPITPPGAARPGSPITAVTRKDGWLDVFWVGADGSVATTWANPSVDNGAWHAPFPITPPKATRADSSLSTATRFGGALDVFWIGPDGAVCTTWANPDVEGGRWRPPFPVTPPGATRARSPLVALSRKDGWLDVFWIRPDGAVATALTNPAVDNGAWQPPFPITPPGAARADSRLAAVTRLEGALDVFWVGSDGVVTTTWANPTVDNAQWHAPFPISQPMAIAEASGVAAISRNQGFKVPLMGRTVLAAAKNNDPTELDKVYDMSRLDQDGKFINLACAVSPHAIDAFPGAHQILLAWGSGRYRDSDVFLGGIPLEFIDKQDQWRFYAGSKGWVSDQRQATPLFLHRQVGELSAAWLEPLGLWLLLYNAFHPRGIVGRVAEQPWGPWSDPFVVLNPFDESVGYGKLMHRMNEEDGLYDPGRLGEWGGEYGPYIIHRFTRDASVPGGGRRAQIYFVMSTWNPYNTVLMTVTLQREPSV